jgi:hypothetical protein
MLLQSPSASEPVLTLRALERSLASVRQRVPVERGLIREGIVTNLALVGLLTRVSSAVDNESASMREPLLTKTAFEVTSSCVPTYVNGPTSNNGKSHVAPVSFELCLQLKRL